MEISSLSGLKNHNITLPNSEEKFDQSKEETTLNLNNKCDSKNDARRTRDQAGITITKIEQIFESLADCILEKKELVIHLKIRENSNTINERLKSLGTLYKEKTRKVCFPSRNPREAWKFTVLLRILELSHEALVTGIITTKRDIYYREPELFKHQTVVDRYLNDIAHTLGVERHALNVVAAAKGLIAGSFTMTQYDCSLIDCSTNPELTLSKQATFRTLTSTLYWKYSLAGKGILITAKGYPDIQTRQFLHFITLKYPKIPILALMDFDPDGIGIMTTYKYGSIKRPCQQNNTVPLIEWLGIKSDFISRCQEATQGLQILSARDRRLATTMLGRVNVLEWKEQLQIMLMLNFKAEIQILGGSDSLCHWLDLNLVGLSSAVR
ncbi:Meiotic recombination protein rec12 [Erysiphe neolycopersici]|uniref:DNA topoisomerase (ATP-hydrolyzing) n=1 Tax=Erysiphe neolycopersici TaxID=212602 RepID=A0A420HIR6_9PEZI|nr:Meiotic recombination protein rec12 [Erysiphe neolycopersici]